MSGFVTGASSGIGQAPGSRLPADRWDLATTTRRGDPLRALVGRLAGQHGVKAGTWVADPTDPGELSELEPVIAAAGPGLLVNNAGFAGQRPRPDFRARRRRPAQPHRRRVLPRGRPLRYRAVPVLARAQQCPSRNTPHQPHITGEPEWHGLGRQHRYQ